MAPRWQQICWAQTSNDTFTAESATATTLDGGKGSDSMVGSSAGDVFYVDSIGATTVAAVSLLGNVGDIVVAGGGEDTIRASVNIDLNKKYTIGNSASTAQFSDVEVVELQGTAALSATGNLNASTTLTATPRTTNFLAEIAMTSPTVALART